MKDNKIIQLLIGVSGIYFCYFLYAIFQQKLFNYEYVSSIDGSKHKFTYASAIVVFPTLTSMLFGAARNYFFNQGKFKLPFKEIAILSGLYFIIVFASNACLVYISFPLQLLARNLKLLVIILVSVVFSRIKTASNTKPSGSLKVIIGIVITVGVLIFNYYGKQRKGVDRQSTLFGYFLLIISLVADGFLADSQAYAKHVYHPSSNELFTVTNGGTFILSFLYTIFTREFQEIVKFGKQHDELAYNLLYVSVLGSIGQMFIYYIVGHFKSHVTSLVTTIRKIFTVIISIFFFNHQLTQLQWLGMAIVFAGVFLEFYDQSKQKHEKTDKHTKHNKHAKQEKHSNHQKTEQQQKLS